ncbi:CHAT domain-containing protein [Candidatus Halobeggiatoa sp. HSG11]|nr:CHAT domain-containing protein [Candidatus Halobeggiatoa sp. HSG11]
MVCRDYHKSDNHPSVFDALHNLANCQQAHLATHGAYNCEDPNSSYLTLAENKGIKFPLWMTAAIRTQADVILLSACESNLNGQATEGLLTPVGIGPTLAAAGAKTVVGTLWPCDGLAALCFSFYFYTISQANPKLPWHQVATQAREKLRNTTYDKLDAIVEEVGIDGECYKAMKELKAEQIMYDAATETEALGLFEPLQMWAGFTVLGKSLK